MGKRLKVRRNKDAIEVLYTQGHWNLLWELRAKAIEVLKILRMKGIVGYCHGSIARGDISTKSDIDIIILNPPPSIFIELALERFTPIVREIIQATPSHAIKAYIQLDEITTISFPLTKLSDNEVEFYKFGGILSLASLEAGERTPGVDKRLKIIIPTARGHVEYSIIGREEEVSELLGVSLEVIRERIRVLTRRDALGRTGVYLNIAVPPDRSFEETLRLIAKKNPSVRKKLLEENK